MAIHDVRKFEKQDDAYEAWRASNTDFVMTFSTRRRAFANGFMVHQSDCGHLSNLRGDLAVTR